MRRRVFVGGAFAGVAAAQSSRPAKGVTSDVPQRVFGKTGQKVSIVGLAGGRLYLTSLEQAKAVVRRAVELGVTYFDNARNYGEGVAEQTFGAVLPPHRKRIFLTSKSVARTRIGAEADLHRSLKALRTDYLDLWQIHGVAEMKEVDAVFAPGGAIEAFEAARKAGKCRFMGFTGHRTPPCTWRCSNATTVTTASSCPSTPPIRTSSALKNRCCRWLSRAASAYRP